jgi:mevalonate pyrophosphate decarboxylase
MKFVTTKTVEQLDLQALRRVRERLGQSAHRHYQSDSSLSVGAWHRRSSGSCASFAPSCQAF